MRIFTPRGAGVICKRHQQNGMASTEEFVHYVCAMIDGAGSIWYRKMFGEYGIYCDGVYCACICDNMFLVKITDGGKQMMPDAETAYPYEGSKTRCFLITDFADQKHLERLIRTTCDELQTAKSRKILP